MVRMDARTPPLQASNHRDVLDSEARQGSHQQERTADRVIADHRRGPTPLVARASLSAPVAGLALAPWWRHRVTGRVIGPELSALLWRHMDLATLGRGRVSMVSVHGLYRICLRLRISVQPRGYWDEV
jgi:hypothetical protein